MPPAVIALLSAAPAPRIPNLVMSDAHDWRGGSAKDRGTVVCIDCGVRTAIGQWAVPRCRLKWERANSGFRDVRQHDAHCWPRQWGSPP